MLVFLVDVNCLRSILALRARTAKAARPNLSVEASFQLRNLMKNTRSTFEALQKLEAPTFEQIFKNEELRREFENLTKKLEVPTS